MRRADELKRGDVTPHFTVGAVEDADSPLVGNGEIVIRPEGARIDGGPRFLIQRDALVEVTGCTSCKKGHGPTRCPRRSTAEDVIAEFDAQPRGEADDDTRDHPRYVAARMVARPDTGDGD